MKTKHLLFGIFIFAVCLLLINSYTQAQTAMWGVTSFGGANNNGAIIRMSLDGSNFTKVYDFIDSTGSNPSGNLAQAKNGNVYGICENGGDSASCVIYSFNPVTGIYKDLYNFGMINGNWPISGLTEANDGNLYGVASAGGINNAGVIYRVNPDNDSYTKLYDFDFWNGSAPIGSLFQASNGLLYGMASAGGANNVGVLYSYNISSGVYTDLYDFNGVTEGDPYGSLIEPVEGQLYGMTSGNKYASPSSLLNLVWQASNLTNAFDSTSVKGNIFSFNIKTNTYADLYHFNGPQGYFPYASLTATGNSKLYGTAAAGGANNMGVLFSFDPNSLTYTDLFDFAQPHEDTSGVIPFCSLMQSADGNLYGTTFLGGLFNNGIVFRFNPFSNVYSTVFSFDGTRGANPFLGGFALAQTGGNLAALVSSPAGLNSISVYPVPSSQYVTINIHSTGSQPAALTVCDINGKTVLTYPLVSINGDWQTQVDMRQLPSGIYLLQTNIGNERMVNKLVKE